MREIRNSYVTQFGDRIPCRDNIDDGCEFEYDLPKPDSGEIVEREIEEYLRAREIEESDDG